MEFAIVKGENIPSEFMNVKLHCRINVSEYQIEGFKTSVFFHAQPGQHVFSEVTATAVGVTSYLILDVLILSSST